MLLKQQNFYLNSSPSKPFVSFIVSDKFVICSNIVLDGKLICMTIGPSFFLEQFLESDLKVFYLEHSCMQPGLELEVFSSQ
jgi:hypothetical protein